MNRRGQNSCLVAGLIVSAMAGALAAPDGAHAQARPAAGPPQRPFSTSVRPTRPGDDTIGNTPEVTADQPNDPIDPVEQTIDPGDTPPPRLRLGRRPVVCNRILC